MSNPFEDAAETVKTTGGSVEIGGVRMEPCDEYGQTETTRRAEAAEAKVDAARALVAEWRRQLDLLARDVLLNAGERTRRDLADQLAAVLDPPPKITYRIVCDRCDRTVATMPKTLVAGPDKKLVDEALRVHECPGVES